MATTEKDKLRDIFGDDSSSDEDNDLPSSSSAVASSAPKVVATAGSSGLFGNSSSSSEDDASEDESSKPVKKPRKKLSKGPASTSRPTKRAKGSEAPTSSSLPKTSGAGRSGTGSGDEYDSEPDVTATKEDDDFIDGDDDMKDILGDYSHDKQTFNDERPVEENDFEEEEEENFFDSTMKSLKAGRKNARQISAVEAETLVQEVIYQMDNASTLDEESMGEGKPAFAKIKLLDFVVATLMKVQLQATLLDFNVLEYMKKWIQPLDNGHLPNLGLRSKILLASKRLPVEKDHLKRSGYGKVVMALWKHPDETPGNKEVCKDLIEKWSRNVFNKSLDYRKLAEYEADKPSGSYRSTIVRKDLASHQGSSATQRPSPHDGLSGRATAVTGQVDLGLRVRIPQQMPLDFVSRPEPKFDAATIRPSKRLNPDSSKGKLSKRMVAISRPTRKNVRAVNMSVEGRGQ